MSEETKPKTTWQTYDHVTDTLTVHVSDEPTSEIYFQGEPKFYDGSAVENGTPSSRHMEYLRSLPPEGETEEQKAEREACYKIS